MTALRKEIAGWIRYYTQLDDMVREFQENENGYFSDGELRMFHMAGKRIGRLNSELRRFGSMVSSSGSCSRQRSTSVKPAP